MQNIFGPDFFTQDRIRLLQKSQVLLSNLFFKRSCLYFSHSCSSEKKFFHNDHFKYFWLIGNDLFCVSFWRKLLLCLLVLLLYFSFVLWSINGISVGIRNTEIGRLLQNHRITRRCIYDSLIRNMPKKTH